MLHYSLQSKLPLKATLAQELCVTNFMKRVSMAKQLHTSPRSLCTITSIGWRGIKHANVGLGSSANMLPGVMNHPSSSGRLINESKFGGCQENATYRNT